MIRPDSHRIYRMNILIVVFAWAMAHSISYVDKTRHKYDHIYTDDLYSR
jgi:hypothetical protein